MAFTEQEREQINDVVRRELKDMTPEEVQLYTRWSTENALRDADFQSKMQTRADLMQARIDAANELHQAALDNLKAQKAAALARLEGIENG
jgi:hypothetical protein